ncbi:MAG: hypothetical protein QM784_07115 [Polyangiaceae bacterium]
MRKLIFSAPITRGPLMEFFALRNWTLAQEYEPEDAQDDALRIEWIRGDSARVTFFDDFGARLQYLALEGDSDEEEAALEAEVRGGPFLFESMESVLGGFDRAQTNEDVIDAFARLVIAAPESVESEFLRRIDRALAHHSPVVRAECVNLLSYTTWHEILPLVTRLRTDPDGNVRHTAQVMSDEFKALVLG